MKVIIPAIGSRGDVFPVLSFGKAIHERGDTVAVITSANFREAVEEAGLEYIELGDTDTYDVMKNALEKSIHGEKKLSPADDQALKQLLDIIPGQVFRLVEKNYEPGSTILASPDVLTAGLGSLVQEKLNVPYVAIRYLPGVFRGAVPWLPRSMGGIEEWLRDWVFMHFWLSRRMARSYQAFRKEIGLDPKASFARAWFRSEQLNVCLFPSWFVPWYRFNLPNTIITHFPLFEVGQEDPLPSELEDFLARGTPPLVFVRSYWETDPQAFFGASVEACKALGVRAIILTGSDRLDIDNDNNVFSCDYASLKRLLPHSTAIVHHGGMGTVARAMAEATPQLVVYRMNQTDQPYNAGQVARLGVGIKAPYKKYNKDPEAYLGKLLKDSSLKDKANLMAKQFAGQPNFGSVVAGMKQLLGSQEPMTAGARSIERS